MKRKVVRQGPVTLMISLPSSWVKRNNVQRGNELVLTEEGTNLIISADSNQTDEIKKINLSLRDLNSSMLNRVVAACYKAGYQEITIQYDSTEDLAIIQKTVERTYFGYDLEYLKNNRIKITSLNKLDANQFQNVERKYFLSIKELIEEFVYYLSTKKFDEIDKLLLMDKQIDMYADFCRRLINQGYVSESNIHCMYYIFEQLEIIADAFKDCITTISNEKNIKKGYLDIAQGIKELYDSLYAIYFDFSIQKLNKLCIEYENLRPKVISLCDTENSAIYSIYYYIIRSIFECKGAVLTMRLK